MLSLSAALLFCCPSPLPLPQVARREALEPPAQAWIEALRDDQAAGNAERAFEALRRSGESSRAALRAGLASSDWQQRFLSAALLAELGPERPDALGLCSRVLIAHLADNHIRGDAQMASAALLDLGPACLPWLDAAVSFPADPQQARLATSLIGDLRHRRTPVTAPASREFLLQLHADRPALPPLGPERLREAEWIRHWVAELGADEQEGNAVRASFRLRRHPQRGMVLAALDAVLVDPDRQRRQIAAHLLRRLAPDAVSVTRIELAIEAQESDFLGRNHLFNAYSGSSYLLRHRELARPWLEAALAHPDPIVRSRCGRILAEDPQAGLSLLVPVLIERLLDNDTAGDAMQSVWSLVRLGERALPWIEAALPGVEPQQDRLLRRAADLIRAGFAGRPGDGLHRVLHPAAETWHFK